MGGLLAGLQQQLPSGAEVVGFVANDGGTPHSSAYDVLAVWKMPSSATALAFETFVSASGLHDSSEPVYTRGQVLDMEAVVAALGTPQ